MIKKIYVGNLPFSAVDQDIRELFERVGRVATVQLVTDRETGQSRGFGFVEMEDQSEASIQHVISALNGVEFEGRALTVKEARPRGEQPGGGARKQRNDRSPSMRSY